MPGILKVRVVEARDLPVMDSRSELTDAYVEIKFGDELHRTNVCRRTLCPVWNTDFRFEAEDTEIQDEVLEARVYDYDTISANDPIGKIYITLNPLLAWDAPSQLAGWYPIYDTLRGIRGELYLIVKLEKFSNINRYRDTSVGVQFFAMSALPSCYRTVAVHAFVEELVVDDDPEYGWGGTFRAPRASNEARQRQFMRLSNMLQRKIGLKVQELGANAIVGYQQSFDIEQEYGLVARGIGTAVSLESFTKPVYSAPASPASRASKGSEADSGDGDSEDSSAVEGGALPGSLTSNLGDQIATSNMGVGLTPVKLPLRKPPNIASDTMLITLTEFPKGMVWQIGGAVSARSVKLLNKIEEPDEPETRDAWWLEIREEIRSHAKALGCQAVIGYRESTTICNELCVLSATGTAAVLDFSVIEAQSAPIPQSPVPGPDGPISASAPGSPSTIPIPPPASVKRKERPRRACAFTHIPYRRDSVPFPGRLTKCNMCAKKYVPELLFSTCEVPEGAAIVGRGEIVEARVCRWKKKEKGEINALAISEAIPFLEYDVHRQLMNKLKIKGYNAVFGLHIQLQVGETLVVGLAIGTGMYLQALPRPPAIAIERTLEVIDDEDRRLQHIARRITEQSERNRERLRAAEAELESSSSDSDGGSSSSSSSDDEETAVVETPTSIMEVDDEADEDSMAVLLDPEMGDGYWLCNVQHVVGMHANQAPGPAQMITLMRRIVLDIESQRQINRWLAANFNILTQGLCFKLRHLRPCCIANISYDVELSDDLDDAAQISMSGVVFPIKDTKPPVSEATDGVFAMDNGVSDYAKALGSEASGRAWVTVDMTTMHHIPGASLERYIGHINLSLIKTSNAIREPEAMNNLIHQFVTEAHAVLRGHVRAMGGNALLSFTQHEFNIADSHRNQGYVLLTLSGDVFEVSRSPGNGN